MSAAQNEARPPGGGLAFSNDFWPVLSLILKYLGLALLNALGLVFFYAFLRDDNLGLAAIFAVITIGADIIFFVPRLYPLRWMAPGLMLVTLLVIYPIAYTVITAFTNYGDAHRLTQQQTIEQLERTRGFAPPGVPIYSWELYLSEDGDYALWLTRENAEGELEAAFATLGEPIQDIADPPDTPPDNYEGYWLASRVERAQALTPLGRSDMIFGVGDDTARVMGRNDVARPLSPGYIYNTQEDLFIDLAGLDLATYTVSAQRLADASIFDEAALTTAVIYTADDSEGFFSPARIGYVYNDSADAYIDLLALAGMNALESGSTARSLTTVDVSTNSMLASTLRNFHAEQGVLAPANYYYNETYDGFIQAPTSLDVSGIDLATVDINTVDALANSSFYRRHPATGIFIRPHFLYNDEGVRDWFIDLSSITLPVVDQAGQPIEFLPITQPIITRAFVDTSGMDVPNVDLATVNLDTVIRAEHDADVSLYLPATVVRALRETAIYNADQDIIAADGRYTLLYSRPMEAFIDLASLDSTAFTIVDGNFIDVAAITVPNIDLSTLDTSLMAAAQDGDVLPLYLPLNVTAALNEATFAAGRDIIDEATGLHLIYNEAGNVFIDAATLGLPLSGRHAVDLAGFSGFESAEPLDLSAIDLQALDAAVTDGLMPAEVADTLRAATTYPANSSIDSLHLLYNATAPAFIYLDALTFPVLDGHILDLSGVVASNIDLTTLNLQSLQQAEGIESLYLPNEMIAALRAAVTYPMDASITEYDLLYNSGSEVFIDLSTLDLTLVDGTFLDLPSMELPDIDLTAVDLNIVNAVRETNTHIPLYLPDPVLDALWESQIRAAEYNQIGGFVYEETLIRSKPEPERFLFIADLTGEIEPLSPGYRVFIGARNFTQLADDMTLLKPLLRVFAWTVAFSLLSVVTTFTVGLLIALILNDPMIPARKFWRSLIFIPYAIPGVISILVWQGMMNENLGLITNFIENAFQFHVPWFTDQWWAKIAVLLVNLWLGYPYMMLICSGALQAVPSDVYEAAAVDGAKRGQTFWKITLPLLLVTVGPLLIASFVFNFNNYLIIEALTAGDPPMAGTATPVGHTDILINYTYNLAFGSDRGADYGYASAIAIIIFLIVALVTLFQFRLTKGWEETGRNV